MHHKDSFFSVNTKLYLQSDGVVMGSSLGQMFANYYMTHIEEKILAILLSLFDIKNS